MPFADKKEKAKYQLNYYHTHPEYKEQQLKNGQLNYWRKKYMKKFNCRLQDCEKFSKEELQEQYNTGLCRV